MRTNLNDLVGESVLDAVDFSTDSVKLHDWDDDMTDVSVCRFRLNGTVYLAVQDPDDGYRSCMRELKIDSSAKMQNIFPGQEVLCHMKDVEEWGTAPDILVVRCRKSAKVVLEIGTSHADDYYPSFVADFRPENMKCNDAAKEQT